MVEKIFKVFTRDFSLLTCEMWASALNENFKREFDATYSDNIIVSNGLAVSCFNLEKDVGEIKDGVLARLVRESDYYFRARAVFRADINETREALERLQGNKGKMDLEALGVLKARFFTLYPVLRLSMRIPGDWADELRKLLGLKADEIIGAAYEDRKYSDGVFEKIDSLARVLCKQNLREAGQPEHLSKFLTEREARALALGEPVDWFAVHAREKGFVYCKSKLYTTQNYQEVFKASGYQYDEEKADGVGGNEWNGSVLVKGNVSYAGGIVRG